MPGHLVRLLEQLKRSKGVRVQESNSILELAREYGWLAVLAVVALLNAGRIVGWLEGLLERVWPELAESLQLRRHERRTAHEAELKRETTALEALLDVYRQELTSEKAERQAAQCHVLELMQLHETQMRQMVEQYEDYNAKSVEVLRDLSESMRDHSRRLERIEQAIGVYFESHSCSEGG